MPIRARTYRPSIWARIFLAENWKVVLHPSRGDRLALATDDIACVDVNAVDVTKALIWHTVEIRSPDRIEKLTGLSAAAAQTLRHDLVHFINQHLAALISRSEGQLRGVDAAVRLITDAKRQYLAHADVSQAISGVPGTAAQALSHPLFDEARIPDAVRALLPASLKMITDPETRRRYNEEFVAHELKRFGPFFEDLGGVSMAMEQREACIRLEDSNLLVASAGSGKSATMVGKVAYVLQKGLYAPEDILVLAYNTSAAAELKERIARQLQVQPNDLGCRVTTFHALGFSIIKEVDGEPPRLANWVENASGEARFIETIVSDLKERDERFLSLWTDLLSLYPKADLPLEAFSTEEEYKRYIADNGGKRPDSIGTLVPNLYVRSLQERRIVNWLWRHTVDFEYERRIRIPKGEGEPPQLVHPDFYYPESGTIHEHFAINKDGTSPFDGYIVEAALKRSGYAQIQADFFETRSADDAAGKLLEKLEIELRKREIKMVARSLQEVLKAIAPMVISRYHRIIGVCVKHIRASRLTRDILLKKAETLHDKVRARHFVEVVWKIAEEYTHRLDKAQRIDYDSMIGDAVRYVETGRYRSPFSLILVDEFQDTSEPRANLVKALKHQKPFNKLFAVGDDWQSIYRFAGSDVTIFTDFEKGFGASWMGRLERTYRCNQALADTAAAFVQRNPGQFRKTVVSTRPAVSRSIRVVPVDVTRNKSGFIEPCRKILSRLDVFLGTQTAKWRTAERRRLKVLVLWRYNSLDPFNGRPPRFENIDVTGLSFHRSKGLEADYTILLDVSDGNYGVPSRIEDDELLNLVIPRPETYPFAEERRLFYVALTRASRGTFLIANDRQPSPFIHELFEIAGDDIRFETADGVPIDICRKCLVGTMGDRPQADGSMARNCSRAPACQHTEATRAPSGK
ncbi:MAG TPA: UvrD-helicase domain-containing protein [Candidatus Sphingomonas excrementigallinarum]|nr:UvrD-helicase domain-containing protein [Candidatus Sphingomonas excrementigallinarum]